MSSYNVENLSLRRQGELDLFMQRLFWISLFVYKPIDNDSFDWFPGIMFSSMEGLHSTLFYSHDRDTHILSGVIVTSLLVY